MSEIAQLQRDFERHTKTDEEHFNRLFQTMETVNQGIALLNHQQGRNQNDNATIITQVSELRKDLTTSMLAAAEAKGSFSSFRVPVMIIVSGLLSGGISLIFYRAFNS